MPIGTDDGQYFEDNMEHVMSRARGADTEKSFNDAREIKANETSGDFQSRFGAAEQKPLSRVVIRTPSQAPTEPAGALESPGGTGTPGKVPETNLPDISDVPHHDWVEGMAKSIGQAMALPGDILSGKVQPGSVQEIERAADLAGLMITGPAPVAAKMADGTLGSFMGVTSKTFDKNALGGAQVLEGQGLHPDEIWNKTGTFRGVDGRWRQEIPDNKAEFKPENLVDDGTVKMSQALDHSELYKAYPWAKDMQVTKTSYLPNSAEYTSPNHIRLGANMVDKSTVLHEIQHAIQDREGFAAGGGAARDARLNYQNAINKHRRDFFKIKDRLDSDPLKLITDEEMDKLAFYRKLFDTDVKRHEAGVLESKANYERLAGEVEARNTETRMLLDYIDRKNIPPQATEDTARNRQLISDKPIWTTPYGMTQRPDIAPIP